MKALASVTLATLTLLAAPGSFAQGAQDAVQFGVPSGTGPFTVPITVSDAVGTPLGLDLPAGERIQAFAITVRFTPAAAVSSATLVRSGLLAGRTPVFETTATGPGTITWVGSFDESAGAIPFTQPPSADGDEILSLSVTLSPGATVSVSLDAPTTTLSDQGGTVSESVDYATLVLGPPVALPIGTPGPSNFYVLAPCRIFDTRLSSGPSEASPALLPGETRTLTLGTRCGVPSTTARSLSVNQTVTGQTADGELVLYRGDLAETPITSSITFRGGKTRANNGIVELSRSGDGTIKVQNRSAGSVHFILDVNGLFQ